MNRMTMEISGMSCGHCVAAVQKSLKALDGVQVEQVQIGSAVVSYDPGAVSPDRIREAVEDEGYNVVGTH